MKERNRDLNTLRPGSGSQGSNEKPSPDSAKADKDEADVKTKGGFVRGIGESFFLCPFVAKMIQIGAGNIDQAFDHGPYDPAVYCNWVLLMMDKLFSGYV